MRNLDLSYKTDLEFWDCFHKENCIADFQKTDLDFGEHFRGGKNPLIAENILQ